VILWASDRVLLYVNPAVVTKVAQSWWQFDFSHKPVQGNIVTPEEELSFTGLSY
jgi:hypothetical protein